MYGKRKALAKRTPLFPTTTKLKAANVDVSLSDDFITPSNIIPPSERTLDLLSTPSVTEGETATDSELETGNETETETETDMPASTVSSSEKKGASKRRRMSCDTRS